MHEKQGYAPKTPSRWLALIENGGRIRFGTLNMPRCPRKLSRKLLISLYIRLAFRVHRIHNEVLVR
jgi:hypothetical protein